MIKPEFWQSKTLRKCSLEARLLFIGLWNFCDDYGVCLDSNRKILGEIFPFDENISEKRLEKWKNELIKLLLVVPIEHDSTKYLVVRSWFEHQKVDNPSKRRYLEDNIQEELVSDYLKSHETQDSFYPMKEKEKEKEKEREKDQSRDSSSSPYSNLVDHWNSFAKETGLSTIVTLSPKRKKAVVNRLTEPEFKLDKIFNEIRQSEFLKGKNERGWKADFDFVFCSANNYLKIIEGKYRTNGTNRNQSRKGDLNIDKYKREIATEGNSEEEKT